MNTENPLSCYICPICASPLTLPPSSKSYQCANRHSFDVAREGYVNLLPVQYKHSIEPGDSKTMLSARRAFLEAGHYQPLAQAIAMMVFVHHSENGVVRLLDVGCGEGYYTRQIMQLSPAGQSLELHGVDIAKIAVAAAAKKLPAARYIVASSHRLPYADQYFDVLLRVFAPSNDVELHRLLKPSGQLLIVTPGPRHLAQLKALVYEEVNEHAEEIDLPDGFEHLASQRISRWISLEPLERAALLQMTPFAWRATQQTWGALERMEELHIETDFNLTLARKIA